MITTRESINYQFSLIFGYSSPKDIIVGNVIGPSKLTSIKVNELSEGAIKFLRMYNAILRDYTGSELFYIEFELHNFDEEHSKTKIYPKSMLLIPGKHKDCESLLLALKPDTGYLNVHKSKHSVDHVSKLFFEVEEFTNHPDLDTAGKSHLLKNFASRFSKRLYGELIEDKWNKSLIGISDSLPTDSEMLKKFGSIKNDVEISWNKFPIGLKFLNPEYKTFHTPFEGEMAIEHLKYLISGPSANFVIENTLKLGTNLMELVNTGTVDDVLDKILEYLIHKLKIDFISHEEKSDIPEVLSFFKIFLKNIESNLDNFLEYANQFITSGTRGSLKDLLKKFGTLIEEYTESANFDVKKFYKLAKLSIFQSINNDKKLIAIDLQSSLNYFSETFKRSIDVFKKALPRFLYRRELMLSLNYLIKRSNQKLENEKTPAKILGQKLIFNFNQFVKSKIELSSIQLDQDFSFERNFISRIFKKIIREALSAFFKEINLNISDLISFAEIQMEIDTEPIKTHLKKFEKFSSELKFIVNYILRYSTINRFLKSEDQNNIADPVTFANRFHRFLEKRMGGINLFWKEYVLEWINDYAKQFFKIEEKRDWTLSETFTNFIAYIDERGVYEQSANNFLKFLDKYIAQTSNHLEKKLLVDFYNQFNYTIGIKTEFPKYLKKKIETVFNLLNLELTKVQPLQFLSLNEEDTLNSYIKQNYLKYFSKLIPRPRNVILKHILTNEERELFNNDLFHILKFNYWHTKSQSEIYDNFKEVYREWITEL